MKDVRAFFVKTIARIVNPVRAVYLVVTQTGGIRSVLSRAKRVQGREGWRGLWRRLRFFVRFGLYHPAPGSGDYDRNDYKRWRAQYCELTPADREVIYRRIDAFVRKPLISILMPVYDPPLHYLEAAIRSIQAQLYPYWELCVADDASSDPAVRRRLQEYSLIDERIKVVFRENNGHISAASNSALQVAEGEYVALLDNDDILPPEALFCVAEAINQKPNLGIIYSDEDRFSDEGMFYSPYFKPDWNRELFYSQNMISHLGVYLRSLMIAVGGFRTGLEGSQDYDLALRCIERLKDDQIFHIPRVLYHWRAHSMSTALTSDVKPYAATAGERALNQHFERLGSGRRVVYAHYGYISNFVRRATEISLVISVETGQKQLDRLVESMDIDYLKKWVRAVFIIDLRRESKPLVFTRLGEETRIKTIQASSRARGLNIAFSRVTTQLAYLTNDQVELDPRKNLECLINASHEPDVVLVGALGWLETGEFYSGGYVLCSSETRPFLTPMRGLDSGFGGYFGRSKLISEYSALALNNVTVRVDQIRQNNIVFDESFDDDEIVDIDFCLQCISSGFRVVSYSGCSCTVFPKIRQTPRLSLDHESTVGHTDLARYEHKWGEMARYDPCYSPNLTSHFEDLSLSWPPRITHSSGRMHEPIES